MTGRHGPPLFSLNYNVALEAVNLMRRREADPHHGQGRDRPSNRPDRLLHPQPTSPTSHLQREASPALDDDLGLAQGVEDLAIEKLVPEPRIEGLHVPVLPG